MNYLFRKGRISVSEYEKEASALDKKIAELREQHKHQTNELRHLQKLEKDLDFIKQALENGYWKVEYEALQSEIKMMWDAALTIDNKTGEVVVTTPRQEKKVTIDFSEAGKQAQEQEELLTLAMHGGGKIAIRQLFDKLHITAHVYHDRVEVRGLIPIGNINISSFPSLVGRLRTRWLGMGILDIASFHPS